MGHTLCFDSEHFDPVDHDEDATSLDAPSIHSDRLFAEHCVAPSKVVG
jgi:hypothetical protein